MRTAIAEAVRKGGAAGIANGGKLGVKFVRTEVPKQKGFNGQKIYTAKYETPTISLDEPTPYDDEELANADPF